MEQTRLKEIEYAKYIKEHIQNVTKAWDNVQPKLKGEYWLDYYMWNKIDHLVNLHDESKHKPDEFEGYRQWFYPVEDRPKNKAWFDRAWLHHKNRNPHHWNYWLLDAKPLPMPFEYIFEMMLDWTAMSYKFNNCPMKYWETNRVNMIMHPETIETVEHWIHLFRDDESC